MSHSHEVCHQLRRDFVILTARAITMNISAFQPLKNVVPDHIPHQYMEEMSQASEIVLFSYNITCISIYCNMIYF